MVTEAAIDRATEQLREGIRQVVREMLPEIAQYVLEELAKRAEATLANPDQPPESGPG